MKRQLLTSLVVLSMAGIMLTACGENEAVTKIDESTAVITEESTEEPTEEVTDPIDAPLESETETVEAETEEVAAEDFLSKNGLVVTPQGSMTMPLSVSTSSDEVVDTPVVVSVVTTESSEEGYSDTVATLDITGNGSTFWWVTAFDRYTGTCFESGLGDFEVNESGTKHSNVCIIDVDGVQYDCSLTVSQDVNGTEVHEVVTVHHPSAYNGVVFQLGKWGATQYAESSSIDYSTAFTVDKYPALLEGQYFFTATDK